MFIVGTKGSKCGIKATTMRIMTLEGVLNLLRAARHARVKGYFDSGRADFRSKAQVEAQMTLEQFYLQNDYSLMYSVPNLYFSIPDNLLPPKNSKNRKVGVQFVLQQAHQQNIPLTDRFLDYSPDHDFDATDVEIDMEDQEYQADLEDE